MKEEDNKPVEFKFALGIKVKDITSGFCGLITSRIQCLNGCIQYTVTPHVTSTNKSERPDAWNLDEAQLVRLDRGINDKVKPKPAKRATGGPSTRASSIKTA